MMKIIIEYKVDESLWGHSDVLKTISFERLIEKFMEDPIEILGNGIWSFDFK